MESLKGTETSLATLLHKNIPFLRIRNYIQRKMFWEKKERKKERKKEMKLLLLFHMSNFYSEKRSVCYRAFLNVRNISFILHTWPF